MPSIKNLVLGEKMIIDMPTVIDHIFIEELVGLYKSMIYDWKLNNNRDSQSLVELKLIFSDTKSDTSGEQDFDLVFLGYLALIKREFVFVDIAIYYPEPIPGHHSSGLYYKLLQHQTHLRVICGQEIFRVYINEEERSSSSVLQSEYYLPLLLIDEELLSTLFSERIPSKSLNGKFKDLLLLQSVTLTAKRDGSFKRLKQDYRKNVGNIGKWTPGDLAGLYLLEVLSRIPLSPSDILKLSQNSPAKSKIELNCKNILIKLIDEFDVFRFSDVEIYCLSLSLHSHTLFEIPKDEEGIIQSMRKITQIGERLKRAEKDDLVNRFYLIYEDNFRRLLQNSRNIAYGLHELAKNIVEHTQTGVGMISGRVYSQDRLRRLKKIDPRWIKQFNDRNEFIDINVFDSGRRGVCSSYLNSLNDEEILYTSVSEDQELNKRIGDEYKADIEEVKRYKLNNFFDFNSVKLFHQINRTKARLGLLIFSQSIMNGSKAFVKLASNDIDDVYPLGFAMFEQGNKIIQEEINDFYHLGTNYNFIVPIANQLEELYSDSSETFSEASTPASVFLELQQYCEPQITGSKLKKWRPSHDFNSLGKYLKLDALKDDLISTCSGEVMVLDAFELSSSLHNSSDWVRFLANLQFSANGLGEVIITNMAPELYTEIVNILAVFDKVEHTDIGFWKKDKYVLFYIPIQYYDEQLETGFDVQSRSNIFWFNSLLCGVRFQHFVNVNIDINQYHNNLVNVLSGVERKRADNAPSLKGPLFSSSGRLLNFELLLTNEEQLSLFEETTRSLVNVEIKDFI